MGNASEHAARCMVTLLELPDRAVSRLVECGRRPPVRARDAGSMGARRRCRHRDAADLRARHQRRAALSVWTGCGAAVRGPRAACRGARCQPALPTRRRYGPQAGTGRGLLLVEEMSSTWGADI